MEAEAVRRVGADGARGDPAVRSRVVAWEVALEDVHAMFPGGLPLVSPGEVGTFDATASRPLPFGLAREPRAAPRAERGRIEPAHVHDGMSSSIVDVAVPSLGVTPVGAFDLSPPRGARHPASWQEVVGEEPAEDERGADVLGSGPVAGGVHER